MDIMKFFVELLKNLSAIVCGAFAISFAVAGAFSYLRRHNKVNFEVRK